MITDLLQRPVIRQCLVTIGCLIAWRLLFLVPLPIADVHLVAWQVGTNTYHGVLGLLAGPALRGITAGALGLSPFLGAFLLLWLIWAISPRLRNRWESRQVMYRDLGWRTLAVAAVSAFGRVNFLVSGDKRVLTSTRGLVSMLLLILGTMSLFGLGMIISRWGAPSGYGVWFLFALQSLLGGLHNLGRFLNGEPLNAGLIATVGSYAAACLILLVSTAWITSAVRVVPVTRSGGKAADPHDSLELHLVEGSLIAAVMIPTVLIQLPESVVAPMLRLDPVGLQRYWSAVSPNVPAAIAYDALYMLLVVAWTLLVMWLNFNPDYVVERLKCRGLSVVRPPAIAASAYLRTLTWQLNLVGGIWLASVVVLVPALFYLVLGRSDVYAGGPIFVVSAALLVDSVHRMRQ